MQFLVDDNYKPTNMRKGYAIGGLKTESVEANQRVPLLPRGNAAEIADERHLWLRTYETGVFRAFTRGTAFPTSNLETGDGFVFNAAVSSGLAWVDTDGTTGLSAAAAGDAARYNGTTWVKQFVLPADVRNLPGFEDWRFRIFNAGYEQENLVKSITADGYVELESRIKGWQELDGFVQWALYPRFCRNLMVLNQAGSQLSVEMANKDVYQPGAADRYRIMDCEQRDKYEHPTDDFDRIFVFQSGAGTLDVSWGEHWVVR